jgi:hypothetical protein
MGEWTRWRDCSAACDGGYTSRTRDVLSTPPGAVCAGVREEMVSLRFRCTRRPVRDLPSGPALRCAPGAGRPTGRVAESRAPAEHGKQVCNTQPCQSQTMNIYLACEASNFTSAVRPTVCRSPDACISPLPAAAPRADTKSDLSKRPVAAAVSRLAALVCQAQLAFKSALATRLDVPLHLLLIAFAPAPAATTHTPAGLARLKLTVYVPLGTDERKKYELQLSITVRRRLGRPRPQCRSVGHPPPRARVRSLALRNATRSGSAPTTALRVPMQCTA